MEYTGSSPARTPLEEMNIDNEAEITRNCGEATQCNSIHDCFSSTVLDLYLLSGEMS